MEWISVKDRLPEKIGSCLVHTNRGHVEEVMFNSVWFTDVYVGQSDVFEFSISQVLHWMPLPKPPTK